MDTETIEKNWNKYESLCKRLGDPALEALIDQMGERIAVCPFSLRTEFIGCYPGGLVDVSLRVCSAMKKINETLDDDRRVPTPALIKVGLLHDLGKVGDLEQDHFLEQDSDWHREKLGQLYKYNESLPKMTHAHRTLYLLQNFGVTLDSYEWEAIVTSGGMHLEENRFYAGSKNSLAKILTSARLISI